MHQARTLRWILILVSAALPAIACGQNVTPDYGFNFITIGDAGNRAYDGYDLFGAVSGRGSVGYEYRIAQTEVTSDQFAEFLNAWDSSGGGFGVFGAFYWGGYYDGSRWTVVPGKELNPVGGISWQGAAVFTNWLHNGKPTNDLSGFLSGAYDTSTFGRDPDNPANFTDQTTRSPGAKYWIPSLDEWIKAAHYDPNKNGTGNGGWWLYSDGSDTQPVPGMPGVGETSAGVDISNPEAFDIPLMAYPETRSPWGLLDTSGGGAEWTEEWHTINSPDERELRVWQGNSAGRLVWNPEDDLPSADLIWSTGADRPIFGFPYNSLRIASVVPAPGIGAAYVCSIAIIIGLRRRFE